ncbi:related to endo-1,4-beta-xylanase B precursor [Rhynchosporium secalis]|uniref:Endo-1,4-beta-xylanase n=1 Tax=Rhynchosporium secalis TaxID=38038 RepID=A0A1E1MJS3_RHYSE|nr:related to endo-1,4-beta-xylanase B precursor [Rhynchosporium secalis]
MHSFVQIFVASAALVSSVLALPANISSELTKRTSVSGFKENYYFTYWSDGKSQASYNNGVAGSYALSWGKGGNLLAGKGFKPGSTSKTICYGGQYAPNGNSYLSLYGWSLGQKSNQLAGMVEYYVVENHASDYDPSRAAQVVGTLVSDGSTYKILQTTRHQQPSILGTATFRQFWSVRVDKRSSGTVTFQNHVNAWAKAGMKLGEVMDYQIIATEGYMSSGSSSITVSECAAGSGNKNGSTGATTGGKTGGSTGGSTGGGSTGGKTGGSTGGSTGGKTAPTTPTTGKSTPAPSHPANKNGSNGKNSNKNNNKGHWAPWWGQKGKPPGNNGH